MDKIRALLIDDESHATETLNWLLNEYCPNVNVEAVCHSGEEGIQVIKNIKPDLVFLDIEMPNMNGFEMLEKVNNLSFQVVFTTAYDQYAIKAFKVSAIDYLLKPIDKSELIKAVKKVANNYPATGTADLETLFNRLYAFKRLAVPTIEGVKLVNFEDISSCDSDGSYTVLNLIDGNTIVVSKTLKTIEKMLPIPPFVRIHNSHIVNLNEVDRYVKGSGGYVVLKNNKHIDVSRSRKNDLLKFLQNF
jgi:two-component system LytT family response regulator